MSEETKSIGIDIPEAKDRITREEADKVIALIKLDRAKLVVQRAKFTLSLAQCDLAIADQDQAIADVERRAANADYPESPKREEAERAARADETPEEEAPTVTMSAPVITPSAPEAEQGPVAGE